MRERHCWLVFEKTNHFMFEVCFAIPRGLFFTLEIRIRCSLFEMYSGFNR